MNGYFKQGNYPSRKTNSVDMKHAAYVHYWTTQVAVISFRIKYKQTVLVQTYYVGLLSFCLHSTGLLRFYVCCSLNAVQANLERNASYTVIMLESLHCYWCRHLSSSHVRGGHCRYSSSAPLTTHLVFRQSAVTFHSVCVN